MTIISRIAYLSFCIMLFGGAVYSQTRIPNPILYLTGTEDVTNSDKNFTRYNFAIDNALSFPGEMFAEAPDLPPCGIDTRASRTWIDFFDQRGKRLYGFCAITDQKGLGRLYFLLEVGVVPPSWVYVEFNDRKTNTKYKSNLAETTP